MAIADVSNSDRITRIHVESLLASKGIDCRIEGSVIDLVSVPKENVEAATRLLRDRREERGYAIGFGKNDNQKEAEGTTTQIQSRPSRRS